MAKKPISELLDGVISFGRLTVLGEGDPIPRLERRALCQCACGRTVSVQPARLVDGTTSSCGCFASERARERFRKHGGSGTPTYVSWNAMIDRCLNPNSSNFPEYGARGITVCHEWRGPDGFLRFREYLGERPKGKTLDRINNDLGYEPGNVRWATRKGQQNNRDFCTRLTLNGVTRTQHQWTELRGWGRNIISERLRRGWSVERALTEPVAPRKKVGR